jgi:hypothetical protein
MELNVHKEVAGMQRQGAKQLRARYADVFGETTVANNKIWLIRRIAWRQVSMLPIDPGASERLSLLATATVDEGAREWGRRVVAVWGFGTMGRT